MTSREDSEEAPCHTDQIRATHFAAMTPVNLLEAKSSLSRLVDAIVQGREREIVIARNGLPAARLVPIEAPPAARRIGVAKGKFEVPEDIDSHNEEVARLFNGRRP